MKCRYHGVGRHWYFLILSLLAGLLAACGGGGDGGVPPATPAAPTSLEATSVSDSRIDLVWVDASGNEDGFRVYRGPAATAVTTVIATLGPGAQSYSDNNGLAAFTTYYYKVTAFNSAGESAASNIDNAIINPAAVAPEAPRNLVATLASGSDVGLTWTDASGNEAGFYVYRGTGAAPASFPLIATLAANATSYTDTAASGTTTYVYRVRAFNASGESPPAQSNAVSTPTVVVSVDGGNRHSLAVKSDGTAWAWGSNDVGALGVGSGFTGKLVPTVVPGVAGATAVSAGDGHSLALLGDGTVMGWGENFFGGVGSGDNVTPQYLPVRVKGPGGVGFLDNVTAVSAGGFFSVALRNDGTVWTWGSDEFGQLGKGTVNIHRFTPGQVPSLTGVVAISAGQNHTLVLRNDGTVWAWGRNQVGQIGNGTTTDAFSPVQVRGVGGAGFLGNVAAVSASEGHSMALLTDGTVRAWGDNFFGELGDGTTTQRVFPVAVSGFSGVSEISAGAHFSIGRKSDGTLWAWGSGASGQIGDGNLTNHSTPVPVGAVGNPLGNGRKITAAKDHSLVLQGNGDVSAWGGNEFGQIGDGTTTDRLTPVLVSGI